MRIIIFLILISSYSCSSLKAVNQERRPNSTQSAVEDLSITSCRLHRSRYLGTPIEQSTLQDTVEFSGFSRHHILNFSNGSGVNLNLENHIDKGVIARLSGQQVPSSAIEGLSTPFTIRLLMIPVSNSASYAIVHCL